MVHYIMFLSLGQQKVQFSLWKQLGQMNIENIVTLLPHKIPLYNNK